MYFLDGRGGGKVKEGQKWYPSARWEGRAESSRRNHMRQGWEGGTGLDWTVENERRPRMKGPTKRKGVDEVQRMEARCRSS